MVGNGQVNVYRGEPSAAIPHVSRWKRGIPGAASHAEENANPDESCGIDWGHIQVENEEEEEK